jgi:hypothetical protein
MHRLFWGLVRFHVPIKVRETCLILLEFLGATRRIRTDDLLITNQLLYRLS